MHCLLSAVRYCESKIGGKAEWKAVATKPITVDGSYREWIGQHDREDCAYQNLLRHLLADEPSQLEGRMGGSGRVFPPLSPPEMCTSTLEKEMRF